MKRLTTLIIITFLLVIAGCITSKHSKSTGVVDVKDVRQTHLPEQDLANHKHHDIEVYRTMDSVETYEVFFYRKENDTLRCYQAGYEANDAMDKAAYQWVDDSLVSIRIYNSTTKKEITLKVTGNTTRGIKSTSMATDD